MKIDFPDEKPKSSPTDCITRALHYLQREAEETGLTETAFLIGVAIASVEESSSGN